MGLRPTISRGSGGMPPQKILNFKGALRCFVVHFRAVVKYRNYNLFIANIASYLTSMIYFYSYFFNTNDIIICIIV